MTSQILRPLLLGLLVILAGCGGSSSKDEKLNRLSKASSPYLREHSDNPVDWYEWGSEAMEKAKAEGKPLIISVGYASCHWCHVMERETFMDTAVARLMNENFVSIKVDREERPDIDQIYMNAAQLISGNGGWPLNAFALPDGKPFYVATYFPTAQWVGLLRQVSNAYMNDKANVMKQAEALTKGVGSFEVITTPEDTTKAFEKESYADIFNKWQSAFDLTAGGLTGAPKFPMPAIWEYALQEYYLTGNPTALQAATTTLDVMARGGIRDQLAGGFSRYSTDAAWKVPHFEKMLYDNGQLLSLYSHAHQLAGDARYLEVIESTLYFVKTELTSPEGGFYSSLNADSEGEEGKFYAWTKSELQQILDEKSASLLIDYYNVTDSGNWENKKNILYRRISAEEFARNHSMEAREWWKTHIEAQQKLLLVRNKRVRPSLDNKILTAWNALMLNGYVDAYFAIGRDAYLEAALKNAVFLEKNMIQPGGQLWRNFMEGKASIDGFLDDYALLSKAYIHLYEATFDIHWLALARSLADYAIAHFRDQKSGLFYYTSDQAEHLVARKMELTDNVIPSSNAILAEVLFRLGEYYDSDSYRQMCRTMLNQVSKDMIANGPYYAHWARVAGLVAYEPWEVAVVGDQAKEVAKKMQKRYLPTSLFMGGEMENLPLLESKLVKGKTIIYVCKSKVCKLPVTEVEEALKQLKMAPEIDPKR